MNKVKMSLSVASINDTIKKLKKAQELVESAKEQGVNETLESAYLVVVANTPIDTGETVSSTKIEISNGKARLTQTGDHVFENEFGDGNLAGSYPGERPTSFPVHNSEYAFVPTNPSSKYYDYYISKNLSKSRKRPLISQGQIAHAQMYHGSQYIRENISKIIKKKVSDALSKI